MTAYLSFWISGSQPCGCTGKSCREPKKKKYWCLCSNFRNSDLAAMGYGFAIKIKKKKKVPKVILKCRQSWETLPWTISLKKAFCLAGMNCLHPDIPGVFWGDSPLQNSHLKVSHSSFCHSSGSGLISALDHSPLDEGWKPFNLCMPFPLEQHFSISNYSINVCSIELKCCFYAGLTRWLSGWRLCLQCKRHRRLRFDPWVGKILWRGNGNPLQYSYLENPMDRGAWRATSPLVTKSRTLLSEFLNTPSKIQIGLECSVSFQWKQKLP